jgi:hypothetical protein
MCVSWSSGYVSDIDYIVGYYSDQSPNHMRFALLVGGWDCPQGGNYLELGFGRGLALNIHAASNPGDFWGNDFMPAHVAQAQALADISGARVCEDSFEELSRRTDLPEFQFITAHGIYTWVDETRRAEIRTILKKSLAPGGAAYLSYNTQPGWADMLPVQRLLRFYVEDMSNPADPLRDRLKEAIGLIQLLQQAKAGAFEGRERLQNRVTNLASQNPAYLVHEYLHNGWQPLFFADVAQDMAASKLQFAACSNPMESVAHMSMPPDVKEILANIGDPVMKEQVRDYAINRGFRKDLFARGGRRLTDAERAARLAAVRIIPVISGMPASWDIQGPMGQISLHSEVYTPALNALHAAARPLSLAELAASLKVPFGTVLEIAIVLVGMGAAAMAHEEATTSLVRKKSLALNRAIRSRAAFDGTATHLASPVTGGGIPVGRFEQFFLNAIEAKKATAAELARHAWLQLQSAGQGVLADGKVLETEAENIDHLTPQADTFLRQQLPFLKKLGVA